MVNASTSNTNLLTITNGGTFGGVISGPIFKNKTFFFASYEALRLRQQVAALADVFPDLVHFQLGDAHLRAGKVDHHTSGAVRATAELFSPAHVLYEVRLKDGTTRCFTFGHLASGALIAGEKLTHKFTDTTRFIHSASGLWKMNDFDDAFYTFAAGLATSVASALAV